MQQHRANSPLHSWSVDRGGRAKPTAATVTQALRTVTQQYACLQSTEHATRLFAEVTT